MKRCEHRSAIEDLLRKNGLHMSSQRNAVPTKNGRAGPGRRDLLRAGAAVLSAPLLAGVSTDIQARTPNEKKGTAMNEQEANEFINGMADLFAHSTRTPVLRRPNEYGMAYEEVFFPAMDGITLEGWFIPANSDRLVICNHCMPANRYGFPGHLEPWKSLGFGDFEVNFLPKYKALHDAGYNVLAYDLRNHGRSSAGSPLQWP